MIPVARTRNLLVHVTLQHAHEFCEAVTFALGWGLALTAICCDEESAAPRVSQIEQLTNAAGDSIF